MKRKLLDAMPHGKDEILVSFEIPSENTTEPGEFRNHLIRKEPGLVERFKKQAADAKARIEALYKILDEERLRIAQDCFKLAEEQLDEQEEAIEAGEGAEA